MLGVKIGERSAASSKEEDHTMSDPPANAPPLNQPHHFELAGDHAQITRDTTGLPGGPLFNSKDGAHDIS